MFAIVSSHPDDQFDGVVLLGCDFHLGCSLVWLACGVCVSVSVCFCRCFSQGAQQLLSAAWSQFTTSSGKTFMLLNSTQSESCSLQNVNTQHIFPFDLPAVAKTHTHTQTYTHRISSEVGNGHVSVVEFISWLYSRLNHHVPGWLSAFILPLLTGVIRFHICTNPDN